MEKLIDIENLNALYQAATPGEWRIHDTPRRWVLLPTNEHGDSNRDANAAFVVAAHNSFPAISAELKAARIKIAELEAKLQSQ